MNDHGRLHELQYLISDKNHLGEVGIQGFRVVYKDHLQDLFSLNPWRPCYSNDPVSVYYSPRAWQNASECLVSGACALEFMLMTYGTPKYRFIIIREPRCRSWYYYYRGDLAPLILRHP